MAVAQQQGERWSTQNVPLEGGLYLDKDVLWQAAQMPGSAISLTNFEPSLDGGYHRILGFKLYDTNQLPGGASQVFGTIVSPFEDSVTAMQGGNTYQSSGSGWTTINGGDVHTAMGIVQFTKYSWATNRYAWVDGDPNAYPVRIEAGGQYTILDQAPTGQKFIQEFEGYLWMTAGDSTLTFSAPDNDNDYDALDGAGTINVGFDIVGLGQWRGALYVFGNYRIAQITGTSAIDWIVTPLTDNIGLTGPYSLQEVNGDLIFMSSDGLRTISGTARIFDRELGVISRPINSLVVPMGGSDLMSCVIKTKSQYRLFQGTASTDQPTFPGIVGTLKLQTSGSVAWEWSQTSGISVACADSGLVDGNEIVVHGAWDGFVYLQDSGEDFNGTAISAIYQTPYLIFNDPSIRKILYKLCANFRSAGVAAVNLGISYDHAVVTSAQPSNQILTLGGGNAIWDEGDTWDEVGISWDLTPDVYTCTNLIGSGMSASFIFNSVGGADYSLQAFSAQYGIGARR